MIKEVLQTEQINTDADSSIKGIGLQKIRAAERLLGALLENKRAVFCTIEHIDDVLEVDVEHETTNYTAEQNKSYSTDFSMNSHEVKNSLRIFFDTWYGTVEVSESIKFVFYTNTNIKKEKNNHVCLIISFVLMIVVEIYSFLVSNIFNVFIFTSILFYFLEQKNKKKQMNYLIQCCDAIIEQKDFSIIDGESKESLLSNKLFLLNKRYHQSLKAIKKEQLKLKDYIEDISHQLKTPITSIRIQTELLLEENQNKKLYAIEHQIQRIQLLVNDLQTIALLDSHNIQYCFKEYDLQMLIDEIEEDLDYLNPQIHLNKNIKVLCDEKWFIEALENIIKNCLEKNSTLLSIFAYENETTLKMMIQDQGNGFKEKDLPFLFQRFYRGENSKGIGLGLYIAKEIIEAHHGFIKAYNQQGACFEIVLPQMKMKKKI